MIKTVYPYMAYADDSGKKESEIVVVGGWVAGAVEWEAFETAWARLIKPTGLQEFKRSGFQTRKYGEEFLLELSGLVHRSLSYGFAC
jgi:hypothetical protein